MMAEHRIVIDTNVVASALRSRRGASYRLLGSIDGGKFVTCLSVSLFFEYEDVCNRLIGQIALSGAEVAEVLEYLCEQAEHVQVFYLWRPFLRDPKDDMILELAVAAGCGRIVTFNRKDFQGVEQFGIGLRTPKEFLREIGELP